MHNGCLLILAFVAVFQPIASYTERGLVDGRQQRCDYRSSVRDPGLNLHGTYRFAKPAVEERRLNKREDIRDVHRNEVREDFLRTASSSDRRLGDPLERNRDTLKGPSRDHIGNDAVLRREVREARLSSYRDDRNQEIRRERVARVQETHPARSPSRREHRRSEYENRYQGTDNRLSKENRDTGASRRDTRTKDAAVQRVGEHRELRAAINRVRDGVAERLNERRLTREGVQRMDSQRSASRIQLDGNADREILERRSRNIERVNRAYNREDSHMLSRDEIASFDRDDRRMSSSRRSVDERRQLRDVSQIRFTTERKNIAKSASRMNVRDLHEHDSEIRREARSFEPARSTESRRENRDIESRLRTIRSVDDRVSRDDDSSRRFARERNAENRRDVRDDRSMERTRSLERSTEHRKDSRSSDRAQVLENQRKVRNIKTRRDIRNIERGSSEVRGETRYRDTCANDRERSAEHRMTRLATERSQENRRVARNVEFRGISTERVDESRRGNDHRSVRTERTDQSRRDNRNLVSRAFRTEQTQRDSSNVDSRLFRTDRADETRRAAPIAEARSFRTEQNSRQNGFRAFGTVGATDNRRNIQYFERLSRSLDRDNDYRHRDNDYRRESRSRLHERTLENRRNIRDTHLRTEDERVANRRDARSLERESGTNDRRRTMNSRLNEIMVAGNYRTFMLKRLSEERRGRATENSRNAQNTHEGRRVRSRGINLVRSLDDRTQRRTERAIERLSKRDSLENRYTLQRESRNDNQRSTERDNLATRLWETEASNGINADFARKREFQAMIKNPTHAENETPTMNWQYIFYTVQALYIGGLLMQLNKRSVDKKTRLSWWSTPQYLTKVE